MITQDFCPPRPAHVSPSASYCGSFSEVPAPLPLTPGPPDPAQPPPQDEEGLKRPPMWGPYCASAFRRGTQSICPASMPPGGPAARRPCLSPDRPCLWAEEPLGSCQGALLRALESSAGGGTPSAPSPVCLPRPPSDVMDRPRGGN